MHIEQKELVADKMILKSNNPYNYNVPNLHGGDPVPMKGPQVYDQCNPISDYPTKSIITVVFSK